MAQFQMQDSPYHSREPSKASNWQVHSREESDGSSFRPVTHDSFRPYRTGDFADSTRRLVSQSDAGDSSPTLRSNSLALLPPHSFPPRDVHDQYSPPEYPGYHPGFPGATTLGSSNTQQWPLNSSPLAIPEDVHGWQSISSMSKEHLEPSDESTKPNSGPPGGPPPDGGTIAWLQVLGGYFIFFNTWGIINAFGTFQFYYKTELLSGQNNSAISWIGTLTSFMLCASPISWGPVFDIGSPRLLVLFGSFSVVLGIMMTSLCKELWQLILAQGVCCGIGGGALFITATSVLPSYFSSKRALAMGISASGSSLGGIIYPIIFTYVQPSKGFGFAVRIIGLIAAVTLAIPCIVIKPRAKPAGRRKIFDTSILKEVPFAMMNLATFAGFVGQYIPYFFIEQFAAHRGIHLEFWMLIFLNVGSIPGRIIPSLVADKFFHPLKVLAATTGAATLLSFCWIAIKHSTAGLIVWCLLYGFCSGAFVSLQGAAVASMTSDLRTIGTRFGINMFAGALGILIGSPVGGAIFPHSWPAAQSFCGATLLLATLAIVATWFLFQRAKRNGS